MPMQGSMEFQPVLWLTLHAGLGFSIAIKGSNVQLVTYLVAISCEAAGLTSSPTQLTVQCPGFCSIRLVGRDPGGAGDRDLVP